MAKVKKLDGFMRGINLGGWISQGENDPEYIKNFITEDDIKRIASWKVDHVRLPVDFDIIQDENENPAMFSTLTRVLNFSTTKDFRKSSTVSGMILQKDTASTRI